jgi:signal transduction histidine kinase/DNA-binding response OmpR family regulator/ligand-binding sensor domain-containing protein
MHKPLINPKTIITLFVIWLGWPASAQQPTPYESISTAQGLSQGMIFDLLQDKEGFIWVATKNGLNRYDGYSFKVFTNDPYNQNTLSSNTIVKLFEDSKGRIWAGTENAGLNIYDKRTGKFYRLTHRVSDAGSISGNSIRSIEELPDGRILVAADDAGLNIVVLPGGFPDQQKIPLITRVTLPNNGDVYGMGKDKRGTMWIGAMDGTVYRFEPAKNSFTKLPFAQLLNNGYVTRDSSILINSNFFLLNGIEAVPLFDQSKLSAGNIIFRPREKLWEHHHREVYFYDVSRWQPGQALKWDIQLPVATRLVYPFIIDRSGLLWSGSVGYGLRKYNIAGSKFRSQLPRNSIRFIIPTLENEIYLGDFAYGWKRLRNDSVDNLPFSKISSVTEIDNFIITKRGDYWIKSDNKSYFNYNPVSGKLTEHPEINDYSGIGDKQPIIEDSKGRIWFPGHGGNISILNTATNNLDSFSINSNADNPMSLGSFCTALFEDGQGIFWIGTQDGFAKVSFKETSKLVPEIKWYYNNSNDRNSLNYNHVSSFMNDPTRPDKYLWIGTKGGGLNRLDKTSGNFFHLTIKDGLPDDVVYGILPDDAGNVWGSTNKGIFCLSSSKSSSGNNWVFRNFSKAEGLQDDEFNTGAYARLPNGNLAFGGVNGLNVFNPKEILTAGFSPGVFITHILVNSQPVSPGDNTGVLAQSIEQSKGFTLSYQQDILTLEFSSLDFTAPGQNKYRYQLVGVDGYWVESGTRRTATYLHLPSGEYTFKVQGSNSQGVWSDKISELRITVLPPWWLTWWAYVIYAVLIALCIRTYLNFLLNRAKLRSQLNFEQLEAKRVKELDTVKTQLYTNITHEFRTPLTVILGMAQQVKSDPTVHLENGIDMIIRNGQSLLNLVNEMLDLSKLETGKMQLQLINGDIINFLRYIVESFHSLAESQQKGLHFLSEIDALFVAYDPEKIRQIITNLLSNALKFTPQKGNIYMSVSAGMLPADTQYSTFVIKVKDTGPGIPESQLQHIFERFYQLDNSHTRKTEGTGIGLALTKELVKLMEGEIAVKSPPTGANKGTEFTVTLPLKKIPATEYEMLPTDEKKFHSHKPTTEISVPVRAIDERTRPLILLVEDNADVVAYTASCLPDYRLAVGKDGKEGFEIATDIIPDLIITDVMMPFIDGFELCHRLKNHEHTSHVPIIMLTAKADMESKMEGLHRGADAYLEKPFRREELLMRIKKLLELRLILQQYYLRKAGVENVMIVAETPADEVVADAKLENSFVKKVREAIEENLINANFTVEHLCKLVFMSHSQLHRKLDALTGCSPNKFIRIIRLNKAKELLKNQAYSISSIAYDCGYHDPGYFGRVFKQEYGVTPQEWRVGQKIIV